MTDIITCVYILEGPLRGKTGRLAIEDIGINKSPRNAEEVRCEVGVVDPGKCGAVPRAHSRKGVASVVCVAAVTAGLIVVVIGFFFHDQCGQDVQHDGREESADDEREYR